MYQLWLDLETTGLNPEIHQPIEIYASIRDSGAWVDKFHRVIGVQDGFLKHFSDEARRMHEKSGLLNEILKPNLYSPAMVNYSLGLWLSNSIEDKDTIYLCGSSVHFDRAFIHKYFPDLDRRLHYRHLDVSVFNTTAESIGLSRFEPEEATHRAEGDVMRSYKIYEYWATKLAQNTVLPG